MHLNCIYFYMSDCPSMTGTCPIKRIDVLTLRQSNFQDVIGSTAELAQCTCLRLAPTMLKHLPIVPQL